MEPTQIVVLPPHRLWPAWTGEPPADAEDHELPFRILARRGLRTLRLDPLRLPARLAARVPPLLQAADPVRALRVLLLERRAAAVLCNYEASALVILLFRRLLRFRGKVVVFDVGGPGWRLRRAIQDRVLPRADAVVVYSAAQAGDVAATWPGVRQVLPMLAQVDCRLFAGAPDCPDGPVVATGDDVSRDYATLVRAADGLGHEVLIRSGRVDPAGLPPQVRVLPPLPFLGYRDLLAQACIVALPLHPVVTAGGVSVLVQAMASGKAMVVSASPGLADHVRDGETALVVPPGDPAALRAAMRRLRDDGALRRRLGLAARAEAERRFSFEAYADMLARTLEAVGAATALREP